MGRGTWSPLGSGILELAPRPREHQGFRGPGLVGEQTAPWCPDRLHPGGLWPSLVSRPCGSVPLLAGHFCVVWLMARGRSSLADGHLLPDSTTELPSTLLVQTSASTSHSCSPTAGKSVSLAFRFWFFVFLLEQLYVFFFLSLITLDLHFFSSSLCPEV